MSTIGHKTSGGIEFSFWQDGVPEDAAFVVLRISGEYSGINWSCECVADSLNDAMAYMDANPLDTKGYCPDGYEVQAVRRFGALPRTDSKQ